MTVPYRKKLIEVALPLEAINKASVRESYIYRGNPSAIHKWWARRPLAAARAVIFAQMVDDPSAHPDIFPTEKAQEKERQRLFRIIKPDDFILAIVGFLDGDSHRVHYIRQPFGREPDFGVTSVNYDYKELLMRGGEPK